MSMIIARQALSSNASQGVSAVHRGSLSKLSSGHRVGTGHPDQIVPEKLRLEYDAFERALRSAARPAVVFSDSVAESGGTVYSQWKTRRAAAGRLVAV